ncbi:hypothetical protein ACGIF2_07450 [Cellulomonas sp. P22]|uniref:hypothetical protein n=1 Tax=Cellulomonas sp. P22 TaxID=3373189 RepID=UPI0037A2F4AC
MSGDQVRAAAHRPDGDAAGLHVDTSAVDAWLAHGTLPSTWLVAAAAGDEAPPVAAQLPDPAVRDDVVRVRDALLDLMRPFRPAREAAWRAVLGSPEVGTAGAHVALSVGWPAPYDAGVRTAPDGTAVVVLDVARLAAYGHRAVTGARQVLDHELAHVAIARSWPLPPQAGHLERLDHLTFDEGLAHWLALGDLPPFVPGAPGREGRAATARAALAAARELTGPEEQQAAREAAAAADEFWDKFGCVAGLLAFADAEHRDQLPGARRLAAEGWRGFSACLLDD